MYTKSVVAIMLVYIHLYHCSTVGNSRMNVKPTFDRVREVIQSVSGVGGQSNTTESNSEYGNPVKPAASATTVPQSELLITTAEPVTTGSKPNQPSETYEHNTCSCLCSIEDFCQG